MLPLDLLETLDRLQQKNVSLHVAVRPKIGI